MVKINNNLYNLNRDNTFYNLSNIVKKYKADHSDVISL